MKEYKIKDKIMLVPDSIYNEFYKEMEIILSNYKEVFKGVILDYIKPIIWRSDRVGYIIDDWECKGDNRNCNLVFKLDENGVLFNVDVQLGTYFHKKFINKECKGDIIASLKLLRKYTENLLLWDGVKWQEKDKEEINWDVIPYEIEEKDYMKYPISDKFSLYVESNIYEEFTREINGILVYLKLSDYEIYTQHIHSKCVKFIIEKDKKRKFEISLSAKYLVQIDESEDWDGGIFNSIGVIDVKEDIEINKGSGRDLLKSLKLLREYVGKMV